MKRGLLASYALLFAGFTLISLSAGSSILTGNAVFNQFSGSIASFAGLAFVGASIGLFLAEGGLEHKVQADPINKSKRRKMQKLAKKSGHEEMESNLEGGKAYDMNESEWKDQWKKYKDLVKSDDPRSESEKSKEDNPYHIRLSNVYISKDALERAENDGHVNNKFKYYKEKIKDILKNPDYKEKTHKIGEFNVYKPGNVSERIAFHREGNKIIIDDLLYHRDDKNYNDLWNKKAEKGEIRIDNYKSGGYKNIEEAIGLT